MGLGRTVRHAEWTRPFWWLLAGPCAATLWLTCKLALLTGRVTQVGTGANHPGPAVYVNWHRHLPFTIVAHGQRRRWMMMLGAPYMAPIAAWCQLMGLRLVRGATGSGGREALAALELVMAQGESVTLAVDGPAGPPFRVKPGCVHLARAVGVPIIPVAYRSKRQRAVTGRWDRLLLVGLFDEITIEFGSPIDVRGNTSIDVVIEDVSAGLRALDPESP